MPQRQPGVPPPFDEGVFLMHYNRGREAFAQERFGEARAELELAQRFRPDDPDVLNLLGLVYFRTNAYAEAEVIYRRLLEDNPSVFILHSNLGLVMFKQGKLDGAEKSLLRSLELRPNYVKSHLYLGLLYKQKGKLGLALEHLRFAGAEKAIRELEESIRNFAPARGSHGLATGPIPIPPAVKAALIEGPRDTSPGVPRTTRNHSIPAEDQPEAPVIGQIGAARKLREAVDDPEPTEGPILDLGRKIEGASRTFSLHENGVLEINLTRSVHLKRGTVSSYSGNLRFSADAGLLGTAAPLVRATGSGKVFLSERGKKTFLLDLADEFIYLEGGHLLALEDTLSYRVEPIYDATYQKKIDTIKIFGRGSLAISTAVEPLTLRVTPEYPLSISSNALAAWTGELIPAVLDDDDRLSDVMIREPDQSFRIRFEGEGVVVSEQ